MVLQVVGLLPVTVITVFNARANCIYLQTRIFTMLAELDKELSQTLFLFTLPLSMKLFWSDLDRDRGQHRIQRMTVGKGACRRKSFFTV